MSQLYNGFYGSQQPLDDDSDGEPKHTRHCLTIVTGKLNVVPALIMKFGKDFRSVY